MFLSDKTQLWDLKLDNLKLFKKIGKGITAASDNFDDHLNLLEFLCITVIDFTQDFLQHTKFLEW